MFRSLLLSLKVQFEKDAQTISEITGKIKEHDADPPPQLSNRSVDLSPTEIGAIISTTRWLLFEMKRTRSYWTDLADSASIKRASIS